MGWCGLDSSGSGYGPATEHGDGPSGSMEVTGCIAVVSEVR